jgi:ferritin-like metal-binding protein YciE
MTSTNTQTDNKELPQMNAPAETVIPDVQQAPLSQTTAIGSLLELFSEELKEMYWTEQHLLQVLPILSKAAHSEALKIALNEHLFQTEMHVSRVQDIFTILQIEPEAKKCKGIEGITKEMMETLEQLSVISALSDVAIIMGTQKAEHYEISGYGSLKQLAMTLEKSAIADILALTLAEEKAADELLTELATRNTNVEAQVQS